MRKFENLKIAMRRPGAQASPPAKKFTNLQIKYTL